MLLFSCPLLLSHPSSPLPLLPSYPLTLLPSYPLTLFPSSPLPYIINNFVTQLRQNINRPTSTSDAGTQGRRDARTQRRNGARDVMACMTISTTLRSFFPLLLPSSHLFKPSSRSFPSLIQYRGPPSAVMNRSRALISTKFLWRYCCLTDCKRHVLEVILLTTFFSCPFLFFIFLSSSPLSSLLFYVLSAHCIHSAPHCSVDGLSRVLLLERTALTSLTLFI